MLSTGTAAPAVGSGVEHCGPFPPAAFPPGISASKCWVAKGDDGPLPHLVNESSVRQGEAGRSDATGLFLPFPKVLQSLGEGWFRLCNQRHKQVVTIRRKPAGLICWWRPLVSTGMNSQDGILMFYLYMQICIDMKMGRKNLKNIISVSVIIHLDQRFFSLHCLPEVSCFGSQAIYYFLAWRANKQT